MIKESELLVAQEENRRMIAEEVRRERKKRKLSPYQLSREAGVPLLLIQRIEDGRNANINTISKVLARLKIKMILISDLT